MSDDNQVAELNAALAAAQGEFPTITADKRAGGRSYDFKYAGLDQILAAVRPVLSKHGLSIVQLPEGNNGTGGFQLRTELRHQAGGLISSVWPFPADGTPQQTGSWVTYWRRYALSSLLGLAAEEDDDGEKIAGLEGIGGTTPQPGPGKPQTITDDDRRKMFAIAGKHGVSKEQVRGYVKYFTGDETGSTASITVDAYDQIVNAIETDAQLPF